MYKTLNELPVAMHETGKETLYPQAMAIDLLVKLSDGEYYVAHADMSLSLIKNIERMMTILTNNRITFKK
jgi:hypothetical protein